MAGAMSFHLGKPILVMALVAVACGAALMARREPARKDLVVWVFAEEHSRAYQPIIDGFEMRTGLSVDLKLMNESAMGRSLQAIFANELRGAGVPDVVEVEINRVGKFFRPPVREVAFEPLRPMLESSGLYEQIVPSRYAPYTKQGVIFGVPHDVHPVGILYREDLFREAGIDLGAAGTWLEFQEACLKFQAFWRGRGVKNRHAVELYAAKVDYLVVMLMQRGVNLVDDYDRVHLDNPKVAETVAFYAGCVAGARRIAGESSGGEGPLARDVVDGNLCAFVCPDWRLALLKEAGGDALRGKLRLMPLPRSEAADAPTATYGGTMGAILRSSPRKQEAWGLLRELYFSHQSLAARRSDHVLPPIRAAWDDPAYQRGDPYFGGQRIDSVLIELAKQIPPRYVAPASGIAGIYLSQVLWKATRQVERKGTEGLTSACQVWLNEAATDLRRRIAQMSFDEGGG